MMLRGSRQISLTDLVCAQASGLQSSIHLLTTSTEGFQCLLAALAQASVFSGYCLYPGSTIASYVQFLPAAYSESSSAPRMCLLMILQIFLSEGQHTPTK
jgi:hypothetical protein